MLWHCIVGHLIKPTDTFLTALRMSVIAFSFFPCFFVGLGFVVHNFLFADTAIRLLPAITSTISTSALLGAYIAMRIQRTGTQLTCTIALWTVALSFTINLLSGPDYENKSIPLTLCFVAVMTQVKGLPLFAAWTICQTLIDDWNRGHCNDQESFLAIPGHYSGTGALVRSISGFGGTFLLGMCAWMYRKQVLETERRGEAAQAAVTMTMKILKHHRRYDTTRMEKVLNKYQEESLVDSDLILLFQQMKESMDTYKPFLPNYVLLQSGQRTTSSSSDEEQEVRVGEVSDEDEGRIDLDSEGGAQRDALSQISRSVSYRGSSTGRRKRLSRSGGRTDRQEDSNDLSDDSSSRGQRSTRRRPKRNGGSSSVSDFSVVSGSLAHQAPPSFNIRGPYFKGKISFGVLEIATRYIETTSPSVSSQVADTGAFSSPTTGSGSSTVISPTSQPSTHLMTQRLSSIVDVIYNIAKETRASIHSFLGDRVQVTWNATHPIPMCESKAATFMVKVREALLKGEKIKDQGGAPLLSAVAGAVCTGTALVHSVTTVSKQAALLITMDNWLPLLETAFEVSRQQQEENCLQHSQEAGCILADDATVKGASYDVRHCLAEAVRLSKRAPHQPGNIEPYHVYATPIDATTAFHGAASEHRSSNNRDDVVLVSAVDPPGTSETKRSSTISLHLLHCLTSLKERATHDEEWMYQVTEAQEDPHRVIPSSSDSPSTGLKEVEVRAAIRDAYLSALHSMLEDGNKLMASAQLSQIESFLSKTEHENPQGISFGDRNVAERLIDAGVDVGFFRSFYQRMRNSANTGTA